MRKNILENWPPCGSWLSLGYFKCPSCFYFLETTVLIFNKYKSSDHIEVDDNDYAPQIQIHDRLLPRGFVSTNSIIHSSRRGKFNISSLCRSPFIRLIVMPLANLTPLSYACQQNDLLIACVLCPCSCISFSYPSIDIFHIHYYGHNFDWKDFTCISLNTKAIKRDNGKGVTLQRCRRLCRSSPSCAGYHFGLEKVGCTHTVIDGDSKDSKMCIQSAKIPEVNPDRHFKCYRRRKKSWNTYRSVIQLWARNFAQVLSFL